MAVGLATLLPGCEKKMEPEQCDKIRGEAFTLLNKAHHCADDKDCRQSDWPGCAKPINNKDFDVIKPMADQFKEGKCEEPKGIECGEAPESYCKQGLCVHREKGRDENAPAPSDELKLE
jgi:hypothetical protein